MAVAACGHTCMGLSKHACMCTVHACVRCMCAVHGVGMKYAGMECALGVNAMSAAHVQSATGAQGCMQHPCLVSSRDAACICV
eukprot:301701-Chlamydomonas_euryale.AAC.3